MTRRTRWSLYMPIDERRKPRGSPDSKSQWHWHSVHSSQYYFSSGGLVYSICELHMAKASTGDEFLFMNCASPLGHRRADDRSSTAEGVDDARLEMFAGSIRRAKESYSIPARHGELCRLGMVEEDNSWQILWTDLPLLRRDASSWLK